MAWYWTRQKPTQKEKRAGIRKFHAKKLPEESPVQTKTGLISIPTNKDKLKLKFKKYLNSLYGLFRSELGSKIGSGLDLFVGNRLKHKKEGE